MMGDNIYGGKSPADYKSKFETPYKALLDGGVKFYASLGNHDDPNERFYKPFNMNGQRYYTFRKGDVAFFALDSTYMDAACSWTGSTRNSRKQIRSGRFATSTTLSNSGRALSRTRPRFASFLPCEPIFQKDGVNVVLAGHEHVYERIAPQHGIAYFVLGNSGELRYHDLRPSPATQKGFDTDRTFGLFEVAGKNLSFQIVSRTGETVDSGAFSRP